MDSSNDSSMGFTTGIASLYKSNHPALFSVFPTLMAEFRDETVLVLLSAQELALKCKTKAQNIRAQLSAIMVVFFLFLSAQQTVPPSSVCLNKNHKNPSAAVCGLRPSLLSRPFVPESELSHHGRVTNGFESETQTPTEAKT